LADILKYKTMILMGHMQWYMHTINKEKTAIYLFDI